VPAPSRSPLSYYSRNFASKASVAVRKAVGRDQHHAIGRYDATLPASHLLPRLQAFFPAYDVYAGRLLQALCGGSTNPLLIDIGANVGDTALLALDAVDDLEVLSVEGDPFFLGYLNANLRQAGKRASVVPQFVATSQRSDLAFSSDRSTGGFVKADGQSTTDFISAADLLERAAGHDLLIWKSDIDGLDIDVLHGSWAEIDAAATAIWFEFDPFMDIDGGAKIPELTDLIAKSGRVAAIFDNTGVPMMTVEASAVPDVLQGLTRWMGVPSIPGETSYLDVWLIRPELAHREADGWRFGR
jgi:FkbM family methyltransferase